MPVPTPISHIPLSSPLAPFYLPTSISHSHDHNLQHFTKFPKMANPTPNLSIFLRAILCCLLSSPIVMGATYNVVNFGAKSDGKTDSTKAFLNAWSKACASTNPASIYVPQGRFLLRSASFNGKCNTNAISITIDGTLVAPSDYKVTGNSGNWLEFEHVDGVSIRGGVLDGQGTALWDCKNSGKGNCPTGATVRMFYYFHAIMHFFKNKKKINF